MSLAIAGTLYLLWGGGIHDPKSYGMIAGMLILGTIIGIPIAQIPLTAVPQRTAFSHAFGGMAAGVVGIAEYLWWVHDDPSRLQQHLEPHLTSFTMGVLGLEVILGFLTMTGSLMACGKLQGVKFIPDRPITYPGQNFVNLSLLAIAFVCAAILVVDPTKTIFLWVIVFLSLVFGVLLIIPIGGADMPTVIALLNSYAGLSACAMGFALGNPLLIIAGALDGSSGLILSIIMCQAMNRSFANVLFGAFGQVQAKAAEVEQRTYRSASAEEAAYLMENANTVVVVPGYGLAVSQAQHRVKELYELLTARGVDVKFAVHPVAGRMPGHMNVLLAEADIPYDKLVEMEDVNPDMEQVDVVLIIGANDVVNPAARSDKSSPIYGMPIIDVDKARTVMVIKRSMNVGFAGIDNPLFYLDKTLMLFGDAKKFVGEIVKELQGGGGGMH
jgi:NAD(P) transhydrogenase subunit beta